MLLYRRHAMLTSGSGACSRAPSDFAPVSFFRAAMVCFRPPFGVICCNFAESGKALSINHEKIRHKYQDEQDVLERYMLHVQGKLTTMKMWLVRICFLGDGVPSPWYCLNNQHDE